MVITSLQLVGFRSYLDAEFEFGSGVNIVVGPNASGKTNLLEALLLASKGKSYRVDNQDLINYESDIARLSVSFVDSDRVVTIERTNGQCVRRLMVNGTEHVRWRREDDLPVVLFEPDHMTLVNGSPSGRRAYLDGILESTVSGYKTALARFTRTLAQRNRLLKTPHVAEEQYFVWDMKFAEYGAEVVRHRRVLADQINNVLAGHYAAIANRNTPLTVEYTTPITHVDYQSGLLAALHKNRDTERMRGFTLSGPHREDLSIRLNNQSAELTASRGEVRSIILALKLAEMTMIERAFDTTPLLLLDDVFSELDTNRQKSLATALKGRQTVLTTTNADTWVRFGGKHFETIRLGGN